MKKTIFIVICICFSLLLNAQVAKTVNITAGSLISTLTAIELSTVTNLTLTGIIDARDLKCMRDEITNLEVVDIGSVSIVAYTGTEGTENNIGVFSYASNEMPKFSFYNYKTKKTTIKVITLPKTITSLSDQAFYNCNKLIDITIPNSIK